MYNNNNNIRFGNSYYIPFNVYYCFCCCFFAFFYFYLLLSVFPLHSFIYRSHRYMSNVENLKRYPSGDFWTPSMCVRLWLCIHIGKCVEHIFIGISTVLLLSIRLILVCGAGIVSLPCILLSLAYQILWIWNSFVCIFLIMFGVNTRTMHTTTLSLWKYTQWRLYGLYSFLYRIVLWIMVCAFCFCFAFILSLQPASKILYHDFFTVKFRTHIISSITLIDR